MRTIRCHLPAIRCHLPAIRRHLPAIRRHLPAIRRKRVIAGFFGIGFGCSFDGCTLFFRFGLLQQVLVDAVALAVGADLVVFIPIEDVRDKILIEEADELSIRKLLQILLSGRRKTHDRKRLYYAVVVRIHHEVHIERLRSVRHAQKASR